VKKAERDDQNQKKITGLDKEIEVLKGSLKKDFGGSFDLEYKKMLVKVKEEKNKESLVQKIKKVSVKNKNPENVKVNRSQVSSRKTSIWSGI
jgi:hypothetical protein